LQQDAGNLGDELRVVISDEALDATKEGLLMFLRGDELLEHGSARLNLLDDAGREDGLGKNSGRAVLALDAQVLGLEVDFNVGDFVDVALFLGGIVDPFAELVVDAVLLGLAILSFVIKGERVLQIIRKGLGAGLDSLFRHVDRPFVLLLLRLGKLLGFGVDPAREFVVTTAVHVNIAVVVATIRAALAGAVAVGSAVLVILLAAGLGLLAGLAVGLLGGLVLLALLWLGLQDERGQLVTDVGVGALAASLAVQDDVAILAVDDSLGVLAVLAQDELVDEAVKVVLELGGLVSAVDNPAVILRVDVCLGAKLEAKVLDDIVRRAGELVGDVVKIDDDGLDTVTLALDLGLDLLHLVAVEGILHVAADVD